MMTKKNIKIKKHGETEKSHGYPFEKQGVQMQTYDHMMYISIHIQTTIYKQKEEPNKHTIRGTTCHLKKGI